MIVIFIQYNNDTSPFTGSAPPVSQLPDGAAFQPGMRRIHKVS